MKQWRLAYWQFYIKLFSRKLMPATRHTNLGKRRHGSMLLLRLYGDIIYILLLKILIM